MKSSTLEIKNTLFGINTGIGITEDGISDSEDVIKAIQKEIEIKKRLKGTNIYTKHPQF